MAPNSTKKSCKIKKAVSGGGSGKQRGNKAQLVRNTVASLKATQKYPDGVPRKLVAALCGYKSHTDASFRVLLSGLVKHKGHLVYNSAESIDLTDEGMKHAEVTASSLDTTTNESQMELAKSRVRGKAKTIINMLSDGKAKSREVVANAIGYESAKIAGFRVLVSGAVKVESLEYCNDDEGNAALRLPDWCFPFGR